MGSFLAAAAEKNVVGVRLFARRRACRVTLDRIGLARMLPALVRIRQALGLRAQGSGLRA